MGKKIADIAYIAEPLRSLAVPIADLTPDAANARTHDRRNIEAIARSLSRWGQRQPIVVQREGMIVRAGNGRLEAAKSLGWTHMAALIVDESSTEATAYAIADNRTAELAEWDDESLAGLLQSLEAEDMADAGFTDDDLAEILKSLEPEPEIVEDEAPEPPADPVTRTGDLWTLGRHRVVCGDCTDPALWPAGEWAMIADPPYNVGKKYADGLTDDSRPDDEYAEWCRVWFENAGNGLRCVFPGPTKCALWHWAMPFASCSWIKRNGQGHNPFGGTNKWEPLWVWGYPYDRGIDVFEMNNEYGERLVSSGAHIVPKPVGLIAVILDRFKVEQVVDPFLGSGTTLIAAEQLGRTCYGIEISPAYCDVIIKRWQNLTGEKATRVDADGKPQPGLPDEVPDG